MLKQTWNPHKHTSFNIFCCMLQTILIATWQTFQLVSLTTHYRPQSEHFCLWNESQQKELLKGDKIGTSDKWEADRQILELHLIAAKDF